MVYTNEVHLPPPEELEVEEVHLGTAALIAGSVYLGKYCLTQNDEYMLCKFEERNPIKCLPYGKDVTACSLEFFRKMRKNCLKQFEQYTNCIDQSSRDMSLNPCRNTQEVLDKCVLEHLNVERPEFAYYLKPRVLDTKRPKPKGYESPEFPGRAVDPVIDDRKEAKYGVRRYWFT